MNTVANLPRTGTAMKRTIKDPFVALLFCAINCFNGARAQPATAASPEASRLLMSSQRSLAIGDAQKAATSAVAAEEVANSAGDRAVANAAINVQALAMMRNKRF